MINAKWLKMKGVTIIGKYCAPQTHNRVVVLCYHSVHPEKSFASATPELFDSHLLWLKEYCEIIPFHQVFEAMHCGERARPAVAITFDDGYADNYEYAFPLLQKHGICATFFLTTGLLEKAPKIMARFQASYKTGYEDIHPLAWSQVLDMRRAGMVFGGHTHSHPNLATLECRAVAEELRRSKDLIEHHLGEPIDVMAYPFGNPRCHYTEATVHLVSALGYAYAAAVAYRPVRPSDSPLSVPRFFVTRDDLKTLREKVDGVWDVVGWLYEHAPLQVLKIISPRDFAVPTELR